MKTFFPFFTLFLISVTIGDSAFAQNNGIPEPTIEDQFISAPEDTTHGKFWTLNLENDIFGGQGEDQNYTNGFRLSYHDADLDLPSWARQLGELYPGFRMNDTTALTYSIGQNMYTPKDLTRAVPDPNDRPYAAWLYGSVAMSTVTDNHKDQVEISLGVVGPAAGGKAVQKFVHNHVTTDADDPQGWNSQLENEPGIVLSWDRQYPSWWDLNYDDSLNLSVTPSVGVSLGNVYTHAKAGVSMRLSPYSGRFTDLPSRVRPSIPGSGYFADPEGAFSWGVFGGVVGYAVGRNIFLDGNTFEDSPSVDSKPFVYDVSAGFDMIFDHTRVSYTLVRRSKEFDGQDDSSYFGSVALTQRF